LLLAVASIGLPLEVTASRGVALCIGVSEVDPKQYDGKFSGDLPRSRNDALSMVSIANAAGFGEVIPLLSPQATRSAVLSRIEQAAEKLNTGDIFLITFSGHGGKVLDGPPADVGPPENDGLDETWCLYDGQLIDDRLNEAFCRFRAGVRILVVTDSCWNGSVTQAMFKMSLDSIPLNHGSFSKQSKGLPLRVAVVTYWRHKSEYVLQQKPNGDVNGLLATVQHLAACEDNEEASAGGDGESNSVFTDALVRVWNGGAFSGDYEQFRHEIDTRVLARVPAVRQHSKRSIYPSPNQGFEKQKPFTVASPAITTSGNEALGSSENSAPNDAAARYAELCEAVCSPLPKARQ